MGQRRRRAAKLKKAARVASDNIDATPERLAKASGAHRLGDDKVRRVSDWPLALLHAKRHLSKFPDENEILFIAGERFCETYMRAQIEARAQDISRDTRSSPERSIPISLTSAEARDEMRAIRERLGDRNYRALELVVGQGVSLLDALHLVEEYAQQDMARAVLLDRVRAALHFLTAFYGFRTSRHGVL